MTAYQAARRMLSLGEQAKILTNVIDMFESKEGCLHLIVMRKEIEDELDEIADKLCTINI